MNGVEFRRERLEVGSLFHGRRVIDDQPGEGEGGEAELRATRRAVVAASLPVARVLQVVVARVAVERRVVEAVVLLLGDPGELTGEDIGSRERTDRGLDEPPGHERFALAVVEGVEGFLRVFLREARDVRHVRSEPPVSRLLAGISHEVEWRQRRMSDREHLVRHEPAFVLVADVARCTFGRSHGGIAEVHEAPFRFHAGGPVPPGHDLDWLPRCRLDGILGLTMSLLISIAVAVAHFASDAIPRGEGIHNPLRGRHDARRFLRAGMAGQACRIGRHRIVLAVWQLAEVLLHPLRRRVGLRFGQFLGVARREVGVGLGVQVVLRPDFVFPQPNEVIPLRVLVGFFRGGVEFAMANLAFRSAD